jgi:carboxypeptidase C (cathepsin A)
MKFFIIIVAICICLLKCEVVKDLPNYPFKGRMFSGYLDLENPNKKLHYLFVESGNNPKTDPLILWLNGGPGCSSLLGWAQEHGPASFEENSEKFDMNPYSWHKLSNIIYLESPAGVGFSYVNSQRPEDLYVDDKVSGQDNLQAALDFFKKFPSLKQNDFYIAGESYAGIYVPTLAANIVEYNKDKAYSQKINLKGFMVGNGVTDWKVDTTPALIDFAYTHALYSPELRQKYITQCVTQPDADCYKIFFKIQNEVSKVNIYDIYRTCWKPDSENLMGINKRSSFNYTPWLFSNFRQKKNDNFLAYLEEEQLSTTPPCVDSKGPDSFFNRMDVKIALNVRTDLTWSMCSDEVGNRYKTSDKASVHLYPGLIEAGLKILIYSGDTDAAVPVNGTQKWISNLNLPIISAWRAWKTDDLNNVAGYRTIYKGLTFVTVKGTGHMVPQWKPKEAFHMLNCFLQGRDL